MTAQTRERILPRLIEEEMRESFLDYSMSVIVQRALPDVRDGLKPVHRRILFSMHELGLRPDRPYKKSATVVGDVLGKYHPHGDAAVYDALVRMVQDFSLRYPLVDGQGNFGSIDGDSAAAYRYTEAKLALIAEEILADIEKETVDVADNFDGQRTEPTVLPSRVPNLLVNGSSGIAVGLSTNVPPHNLREVVAALKALIEEPEPSLDVVMRHLPGPDFPTGGFVVGHSGIRDMYEKGRGRIVMRARIVKEALRGGKEQLVVTELPYAVSKSRIIQQIAGLARKGRIDALADIRDESDRDGLRLVMELKRGAKAAKVIQLLHKKTSLHPLSGPSSSPWITASRRSSRSSSFWTASEITASRSSSVAPGTISSRPRRRSTRWRACWRPLAPSRRSSPSSAGPRTGRRLPSGCRISWASRRSRPMRSSTCGLPGSRPWSGTSSRSG